MERRPCYGPYAQPQMRPAAPMPWMNLLMGLSVCVGLGIAGVFAFIRIPAAADTAPLEVHWAALGENGASGYVKNISDHTVNGWQLRVSELPHYVTGDLTPVYEFATFEETTPGKRILPPQGHVAFTVSAQYVGQLHWPTVIKLMDAADNDLGTVQQEYQGERDP